MEDDKNSATGLASPCIGLAFTPKAMAAGEVDPGAGSRVSASSYPLREQVSTARVSLPLTWMRSLPLINIVLMGRGHRSSGATATSAS